MRNKIIFKLGLLALASTLPIHAVDTFTAFDNALVGQAFDRYTGTFYVGSSAAETTVANTIAKAGRTATTFTGIAADANSQAAKLAGMFAIASTTGQAANYVGFNSTAVAAATGLSTIATSGTGTTFSAAVGASNDNEINTTAWDAAATTISKIAGGYYDGIAGALGANAGAFFFVRARAHATQDFTATGGIKAFRVNDTGTAFEGIGTGAPGAVVCVKYDRAKGATGDGAALRQASANAGPLDETSTSNNVKDMYWDARLNTLFIASSLKTLSTANSAFYMAISKVKFNNDTAALTLISDIIPVAANAAQPQGGGSLGDTAIFASSKATVAQGGAGTHSPRIYKIRTMHTSTGKIYLIVNGGIKTDDTDGVISGNEFYALRYNKDAVLGGGDLATAPYLGAVCLNDVAGTALDDTFTLTGDQASLELDGGNRGSLFVGGSQIIAGTEAIIPAYWSNTRTTSDMQVVGDTVYVSYGITDRDADNDPGVWSSTAQFDKDGVIIGWTLWERVMPTDGTAAGDRTLFFAVDAASNKLWKVDNATATTVTRSAWETSNFTADSLPAAINAAFNGTFKDITCVLDLPWATPGIAVNVPDSASSMALFGGYERVAFARTEYANATNPIPTPINGFAADGANFKSTDLPGGAGTVRCLGWTRYKTATGFQNYFLAGTDTGLFAYVNIVTDKGYNDADGIGTLLTEPFNDTFTWKPLMNGANQITGPVTAIDCDGEYIYVVEQDVTTKGGITSKLWRIKRADSIALMETNAATNCVAKSGKDEIPAKTLFTGFKFLTDKYGIRYDDPVNGENRGLLSTNRGLFQSSIRLRSLVSVESTVDNPNGPNAWDAVSSNKAYHSLSSPKRVDYNPGVNDGATHRIFANTFADDSNGYNYFQKGALRQFGASFNMDTQATGENTMAIDGGTGIISYSNRNMKTGTTALTYLDGSTAFWTDGGRRFVTQFNGATKVAEGADYNMLASLPFDSDEWALTAPFESTETKGKGLYWIENIYGQGIILVGTTEGVIALN